MTHCNTCNVKLTNSQLNKLKPGIKKWYLNLPSNMVGDSITDKQASKLL